MKKALLIIAFLSCLTGCAELLGVAVVELSGYVASEAIGKGITAIDESNKRIEEEKKAKEAKP